MPFDKLRRLFWGSPSREELSRYPALERGNILFARRRRDEAIAAYTQAILEAGDDARARAAAFNKRGVVAMAEGDRDGALGDFVRALEALPSFAPALTNFGNVLLEENALDDAIDHYEAALRYDPDYAPAYRHLGLARKRAGDLGGSVRYLRRAARLESKNAAGRKRPKGSEHA